MLQAIKLGSNCLIVTALTYSSIMFLFWLPIFQFSPTLWAGKYFDIPTVMAIFFVYTIMMWAIIGALIALCMLVLNPKMIVLYGLVSGVTFIFVMNSWDLLLDGNTYGYLRELVLLLTIPYLYSVYVRVVRRRHDLSRHSTREDAGR